MIKRTAFVVVVLFVGHPISAGTIVRFETVVGDFDVELFDATAPTTVTNFLNYVADQDYDNSILHRSVPDFVIQGGGYYADFSLIPENAPINDEVDASNLRGTIAMARAGPNTATNQWFINTEDNTFLDTNGGGMTVFGEVIGNGMDTVDAIAALPIMPLSAPFGNLPVLDDQQAVDASNLAVVHRVTIVPEPGAANISLCLIGLLALAMRLRCPNRDSVTSDLH